MDPKITVDLDSEYHFILLTTLMTFGHYKIDLMTTISYKCSFPNDVSYSSSRYSHWEYDMNKQLNAILF